MPNARHPGPGAGGPAIGEPAQRGDRILLYVRGRSVSDKRACWPPCAKPTRDASPAGITRRWCSLWTCRPTWWTSMCIRPRAKSASGTSPRSFPPAPCRAGALVSDVESVLDAAREADDARPVAAQSRLWDDLPPRPQGFLGQRRCRASDAACGGRDAGRRRPVAGATSLMRTTARPLSP